MFSVAFVLLFIFPSTICKDERQEIILNYYSVIQNGVSTLKCEDNVVYLKDEWPTVIILNTTQTVWHYKCYSNERDWNVQQFINTTQGAVGKVAAFMKVASNILNCRCNFYLHKNNDFLAPRVQLADEYYTELICSFVIHMKYNWKKLTLEINSEQRKTIPALFSMEVDTTYVYEFVENELVKVQCNKPKEFGHLYFVYSGNNLNYSSVKKPQNDVSFEVILGTKQNNSRVDCIFSQNNNIVTLRTYFFLKNQETIRVNDLAIRRQKDTLIYEYDSELPQVLCPGNIDAKLINKDNEYEAFDAKAVCSVDGKNKTIFIKKKIPHHGFFMEGLSIKNMVLKTCEANSCIIYYEYADGDVISMRGSIDNVICDRNDSLTSKGIYELQMKSDVHMKNITCFIPGNEALKTTLIFLVSERREHQNPQKTAPVDDSTNMIAEDITNLTIPNDDAPNFGGNFLKKYLFYVVGAGLSIIILLLVLASLVCILRKRRKPTTEGVQSDVDYVNLDHKNNEQFPKRLNANVYLKPQESNDYAVPVDNSVDANLYSVPYKHKPNEELYAKPVPKNQRYVNADAVKYAAIAFKKPEHMYTNVNNKDNTEYAYAQVHVRPEDLYAKVQPKCKRSDGTRPTNPNIDDYAEPTYCEVGAIRK